MLGKDLSNNIYFKRAVNEEIDLIMVKRAYENLSSKRDISEYVLYDVHIGRVAKALKIAEYRTQIEDERLYKMIQKEAQRRIADEEVEDCEYKVKLYTEILSNEKFKKVEGEEKE